MCKRQTFKSIQTPSCGQKRNILNTLILELLSVLFQHHQSAAFPAPGLQLSFGSRLQGFASIEPQEHLWGQEAMLRDRVIIIHLGDVWWGWGRGSVRASQVHPRQTVAGIKRFFMELSLCAGGTDVLKRGRRTNKLFPHRWSYNIVCVKVFKSKKNMGYAILESYFCQFKWHLFVKNLK